MSSKKKPRSAQDAPVQLPAISTMNSINSSIISKGNETNGKNVISIPLLRNNVTIAGNTSNSTGNNSGTSGTSNTGLVSSIGAGHGGGAVPLLDNLILNSTKMAYPLSESPFIALTTQQKELQKLLMASMKKQFKTEMTRQHSDEINVKEAFQLKPLVSKKAPSSSTQSLIANQIPYSKAAEEAIITEAMKSEFANTGTMTSILGTYQISALAAVKASGAPPIEHIPTTASITLSSASRPSKDKPSKSRLKETKEESAKAAKEKDASRLPRDKEEIARQNKEKEERNALRLKQLTHDLEVAKYKSFFIEEARPIHIHRKKCFRDSLLDEIQWLAIDFKQERRWKLAVHQSISGLCAEEMDNRLVRQMQLAPEHANELRTICSRIANQVADYWRKFNIYDTYQVPTSEMTSDDAIQVVIDETSSAAVVPTSKYLHEAIDAALPSLIESLRCKNVPIFNVESNKLLYKQVECLNRVAYINSLGYGAILSGPAHCGKTTLSAQLVREWIAAADGDLTSLHFARTPCVLVFVPWYAVTLWHYRLQLMKINTEIWNQNIKCLGDDKKVLIVCSRDAKAFSEHYLSLYANLTHRYIGVLIDCREHMIELVKSSNSTEILRGSPWVGRGSSVTTTYTGTAGITTAPSTDKSECIGLWMHNVFKRLSADIKLRCVILDDLEGCAVDRAQLLSALIPPYFAYLHTQPPVRRCLDFMERLKVKCDVDDDLRQVNCMCSFVGYAYTLLCYITFICVLCINKYLIMFTSRTSRRSYLSN